MISKIILPSWRILKNRGRVFIMSCIPRCTSLIKMYNGTEIGRGETGYVNFWDWAIPQKRNKAGIAMWGFASDDCHDINSVHFNRGWILINSQNSTSSAADIKTNILAGNFFSVARAPDDPTTPDVNEQDFAQIGGSRSNGPFVMVTVESGNLIHVITDVYGHDRFHRPRWETCSNGIVY